MNFSQNNQEVPSLTVVNVYILIKVTARIKIITTSGMQFKNRNNNCQKKKKRMSLIIKSTLLPLIEMSTHLSQQN